MCVVLEGSVVDSKGNELESRMFWGASAKHSWSLK